MKVHYGTPGWTVVYDWNGKPKFWGARAGSCKRRAVWLAADPRATNIRLRYQGREHYPEDVELTYPSDRRG